MPNEELNGAVNIGHGDFQENLKSAISVFVIFYELEAVKVSIKKALQLIAK